MTTLYLKLYGLAGLRDLKMIVANCSSVGEIKVVRAVYRKDGSDLVVEVKNEDSKARLLDVIKLAGDIRVEEQADKERPIKGRMEESIKPKQTSAGNYLVTENASRRYFIDGLLMGFTAISLLLNVIMAYLLFRAR